MNKFFFIAVTALVCGFLCAAEYKDAKSAMDAGNAFQKEKKFDEAVEAFQAAAALYDKPSVKIFAAGKAVRLLCQQNKHAEAVAYMKIFGDDEKMPPASRAAAYMECGNWAKDPATKLECYDLGISMKSGDKSESSCLNGKATLLMSQNKADEALALFTQVAENGAYDSSARCIAYNGLVKQAIKTKDFAKAHALSDAQRQLSPDAVLEAAQNDVKILTAEGKYEDAVKEGLAIVEDTRNKATVRARVLDQVVTIQWRNLKDAEATKKSLELFSSQKLPITPNCAKIRLELN